MKGDLGIIEIHHRERQAMEVTGRGMDGRKKTHTHSGTKKHKYYFPLIWVRRQLLGGRQDLNLNVNESIYLGQRSELAGDCDPFVLVFSFFVSGTRDTKKKKKKHTFHTDKEKGKDPDLCVCFSWMR